MSKILITLKKSLIGRTEKQKKTVEALGLKKIGQSVVKEDNSAVRGMIHAIDFMLDVEDAE